MVGRKNLLNQSKSGAFANAGATSTDNINAVTASPGLQGLSRDIGGKYPPLYDRSHLIYNHRGVSMEGLGSYHMSTVIPGTNGKRHVHNETSQPHRDYYRKR